MENETVPKGIVLVKCKAEDREEILSVLLSLERNAAFSEKYGSVIDQALSVFGWPDIAVIVWANNINLMKESIVALRKEIMEKLGRQEPVTLETSSIVCIDPIEAELSRLTILDDSDDPTKCVEKENKRKVVQAEFAALENFRSQHMTENIPIAMKKFYLEYSKLIEEAQASMKEKYKLTKVKSEQS
jgi:hypothetical protein